MVSEDNASNSNAETYVEISLDVLKRFKRPLSFDLYLKRGEHSYTKVFQKDDEIDWDRVKNYVDKGLQFFCVKREEYQQYGQYVERLGELLPNALKKLDPDAALGILKEMIQLTMDDISYHHQMTIRAMNTATNVVVTCLKGLHQNPKSFTKIISMMAQSPATYKHAISVSVFSILVAENLGIGQDKTLTAIGLGGFLHDIGLCQLDFYPYDYQELSPEKKLAYERHPEMGKQLLDSMPGIDSAILSIVLQHHECPNGRGFPNGLREGDIFPPAKIVGTVDTFIDLISRKMWRPAFTVEQALLKMRAQTGDFDTPTIKALQKILLN